MAAKPKITRFTTVSGSLYEINHTAKTWSRPVHAPESSAGRTPNGVRTSDGTFRTVSPIRVGATVVLTCDPIVAGADVRSIQTTPVVRILPPMGDA